MKNVDLPTAEIASKENLQKWEEKIRVLKIPDRYGYVVEDGIIDTVAALQLLGVNTTQSCSGHDWKFPYVQFETEKPADVYVGEAELKRAIMHDLGIDPEEIDSDSQAFSRKKQVEVEAKARKKLFDDEANYTNEFEKYLKKTNDLIDKVQGYIDHFYKSRTSNQGAGEIKVKIGFPYRAPQYPKYLHDIPFLDVGPVTEERELEPPPQDLVVKGQEEMSKFTDFLKLQFGL